MFDKTSLMKNFLSKDANLLLVFLLAAVSLRLFSFFPSVLDHDESTYLIIGRDILHGKALYKDVTDTKPVGIFMFYAALEFLFGQSIFLKRLAFALVVGATGFLVHKVSFRLFKQKNAALASGFIYLLYTSIWTYHGRSPNTELLFNFTTIAGLLLFLKRDAKHFFAAGLIMGIGFIIKYLVLFDFFAFMLFFFVVELENPENKKFLPVLARYFLAGLAFLLPFGLVNLYFYLGDHFQDFYFITYELPGLYGGNASPMRYLIMLLDFIAKFLPISFILFYVIFNKKKPLPFNYKWFFALWILCVLIAMYLPGKEFSHYTIQLMLPFSLLAGMFFHPEFKTDKATGLIFSRKYGFILLAVVLLAVQVINYQNEVAKPDVEREVATYIKKEMKQGDKIYVSNYQQIIYYLVGIDSPTKFVHSNLLFTPTHKAFKVNAGTEIGRILGMHPKFVLVQGKNDLIQKKIQKDYRLLKTFRNGRILLYALTN